MSEIPNARPLQLSGLTAMADTITACTLCSLSETELNSLVIALIMMDIALARDKVDLRGPVANIIFTDQDGFPYTNVNPEVHGNLVIFIPLYVSRWRIKSYSQRAMITIILEELCHWFYREPDERLVEDRVTAAFQTLDPDIRHQDLYTSP